MDDSDKDSIIVDADEKFVPLNYNLKKFEKTISKMRNSEKYKELWQLNCYNFKKRSLRDNLCRFCVVIKPERGYHCKQCRTCTRKMDHHCLFINNCIGFNSYKLFINMLFYASITCGVAVVIMIDTVKFVINEYSVSDSF